MDNFMYIAWFAASLTGAYVATRKQRSYGYGLLVGFCFGFIGVLVLALMKPLPAQITPSAQLVATPSPSAPHGRSPC